MRSTRGRIAISKRRTLLGITAIVIFAINVVFGFTVIRPQEEAAASLQERSSGLRRQLLGLSAPDSQGKNLTGIEAFKRGLPDAAGLTEVVEEIHRTARLNGLKIPEGDYRPETIKETGISRYTISFPVEGRYGQIKKFIYDLETSKHPAVVEELMLASTKTTEGRIGLNLRISVYFL